MATTQKIKKPAPKKKSETATNAVKKNTKSSRAFPRASFAPVQKAAAINNTEALLPVRLQAVVDKSEISDVLYALGRGLDRLDETLLRAAFHPDSTIDLGPGIFQGTGSDYVLWALASLGQTRETHHLIGNIRATLEHDTALVESYCHAHCRLDKPTGREDVFIGSRFLDRMERRPSGPSGVWKIVHRKQIIDWVRTEAVSDIFYHQNPDALWSYRTKTDPSYQMAQFPGSQSGSKLPAFLGRRYESKSVKF